jgi:hypothetical protein
MGKLNQQIEKYQSVILELLEKQKQEFTIQPELADHLIVDELHRRYQLLRIGWVGDERILQILLYLEISKDGKIWIQENTTDLSVDEALLKQGVPANHIVLGLHHPTYRKFSDFAEA